MKGWSLFFSTKKENSVSGDISFMGHKGDYSKFAEYISKRSDIDPNGCFDIIAHGNSDAIQIVNGSTKITIDARTAARLIIKQKAFQNCKCIRLFSCNTGANKNGFAQNLANALGKRVYAPNMTIYTNIYGVYWIANKGVNGDFVKFIPGGNKNGK